MRGGREIFRIASSSRCLLSNIHPHAPYEARIPSNRPYTTSPPNESPSSADSPSEQPPAVHEPPPSSVSTLSERLRAFRATEKAPCADPAPGPRKATTPGPVSLKSYKSVTKKARGGKDTLVCILKHREERKALNTRTVSLTSAFAPEEETENSGAVADRTSILGRKLQLVSRNAAAPKRSVAKPKRRRLPSVNSRQQVPHRRRWSKDGREKKPRGMEALYAEGWNPEPWADVAEGKVLPPHVTPVKTLAEGEIGTDTGTLVDVAPPSKHQPVATLAHDLDRVLFNPGVHWLRDPRSRVYNFTPYLEEIPKVNDFAFERLYGFVKSSRDEDLRALAVQEDRKFAGSTSSMSGMLSHIYFLLSEYKDVELTTLSQHFANQSQEFTWGQRAPTAVLLNYKDGHYAIDSYAGEHDDSSKNVLTWLGTLLENFLTKPPKEFKNFLRQESAPPESDVPPLREAYRYAKSEKMVMRSQLDCHDPRLPGTGVFDLKTRACVSIRQDILNYKENAGYMIKTQHGILESFEREYYDLIRSAFLKYSFQVRIGNMDGVMVAYHNTERIYGFQYVSLDEMDERLYGPVPGIGDKIFKKCIGLLETILEEAIKLFPEQSVKCYFETPLVRRGFAMEVFIEPEEWDETLGPKPVEQLSVTVSHFLDGEEVKARTALRSVDQEWTMKYQIHQADLPLEVVRASLDLLIQRKIHSMYLPSDVDPDQAEEFWNNLDFSGQGSGSIPEGNVMDLLNPMDSRTLPLRSTLSKNVQLYRQMSREGRLEYEKMKAAEKGMPKILLGHGVYTGEEGVEDVQESANP